MVEEQFLYPLFFAFSPVTNGSVNAWLVHLSGYVNVDGVYNSYGSPYTSYIIGACYIYSSGDVNFSYGSIGYSYGINSPDIDWVGNAYDVNSYGDVDYGNYLGSSYGSPGNGDMHSFNIYVNGDILKGGYDANIFRSYG